jgi:hypothetical protein
VIVSDGPSTTAPDDSELWTIRGLVARHKLAASGLAAATAVMVALILVSLLGSTTGGAVSDATTCSEWGSANTHQQAAYARLYVRKHGPLRGGGTSPANVIAAINTGCTQAYEDDVSDTATVLQAITGNF